MFRVLRLFVAVGVLLAASLTGCILSAAEYGDVQQALAVERKALGNVGMMFGGIGLAMTALTVYAIRLRRSAAQLRIDHAADLLLIDALDQLRAAIAIFDHDMKAVHWNCGFEARFPALVPLLQHGATMSEAYTFGYRSGIFSSDLDCERIDDLARETMQKVLGGKSVQHMVTTPAGQTFDLGIFQLGTRHFGAIWVDVTEVHRQQDRITAQSRELERKNRQLLAFSTVAAHDLKAPLRQQGTFRGECPIWWATCWLLHTRTTGRQPPFALSRICVLRPWWRWRGLIRRWLSRSCRACLWSRLSRTHSTW